MSSLQFPTVASGATFPLVTAQQVPTIAAGWTQRLATINRSVEPPASSEATDKATATSPGRPVEDGAPELFWVSPDMSDLIQDLVDDFRVVDPAEWWLPDTGYVCFAAAVDMGTLPPDYPPLTGPPPASDVLSIPIRAIGWAKTAGLDARTGEIVHIYRIETFIAQDPTREAGWTNLRLDRGAHDMFFARQPSSFLAALSVVLTSPGLAEQTVHKSPSVPVKANARGRQAARQRQPPVRVVNLRTGTPTAEHYNRSEGKTREYRHRFMVRGHIRNQPYPSLGEGVTKPIYIAPYLKGSDDLPLLTSPKVTAIKGHKKA